MDKTNSAPFTSAEQFPNDITITGMLVGKSYDDLEYTSKKTGLRQTLKRAVLVLQTKVGIVLCRSYNAETDLNVFEPGKTYVFPIAEYKIDNGVKSATVRL